METFGEELDIDDVGGLGGQEAQFPVEDLAGDEFKSFLARRLRHFGGVGGVGLYLNFFVHFCYYRFSWGENQAAG